LWSTLLLSTVTALLSVLCGLTLVYYADLPPGASIVLVAAALVLTATFARGLRRA
jgi:zinc transport system permease protein